MSQASLIYSKLYNNSTVGFGAPTQRISPRNSTSKASWGWAPTKRISPRNLTSKASWGGAPTKRILM